MVMTGWIAEEEPDAGPALPITSFVLSQRAGADTGRTLGQVLARAGAATDRPYETPGPDADERAASLLGRGYTPGALSQMMGELGDVEAELEAEREKIAKGAQRAAIAHREHAAGRVDAWQMMRMMDGDEGDENRVRQLEHRRESLRARIADEQEAISPPERRASDPVQAAASRAARIAAAVAEECQAEDAARARARAQLGRDRAAFYAARGERRPFASRGAGGAGEAPDPDWARERALREAVSGVRYR